MDLTELLALADEQETSNLDISLMINAERKMNGATGRYLIEASK